MTTFGLEHGLRFNPRYLDQAPAPAIEGAKVIGDLQKARREPSAEVNLWRRSARRADP
jgi:hypothetical protein